MRASKLVHISGDPSAKSATIVVGGIRDTYNHFESWLPGLAAGCGLVVGFDHDHQSSTMKASSGELAEAIRQLRERGIEEVTVIAHSMGGLVSKAALNELVRTGDADAFKGLDLHALGTPWGGFALSSIPGSRTFGPMVGFPMAREMAPESSFMKGLSADAWPEHMRLSIYQGTADNVSLPSVLATHERYGATISQADKIVVLSEYGHSDYVKAGVGVLDAAEGLVAPTAAPVCSRTEQADPAPAPDESVLEMD